MAEWLPKFGVFGSLSDKKLYLQPEEMADRMKFEEVDVHAWGVKHEIEKPTSDEPRLRGYVHIKCCATGKYWKWNDAHSIAALAKEPGDDISKDTCTLINPSHIIKDGVSAFNLQCGWLGKWYPLYQSPQGYIVNEGTVLQDFIISDWKSFGDINIEGGVTIGNSNIGGGGNTNTIKGGVSGGNSTLEDKEKAVE